MRSLNFHFVQGAHLAEIESLTIQDHGIGKTSIIVAGFLGALSEQVGIEYAGIIG